LVTQTNDASSFTRSPPGTIAGRADFIHGKKWCRFTPSKGAAVQAAPLEAFAGTARTQVVAAKLFLKQLIAVNDLYAALHIRFGRESPPTLAHRLENIACSSLASCRMAHLQVR